MGSNGSKDKLAAEAARLSFEQKLKQLEEESSRRAAEAAEREANMRKSQEETINKLLMKAFEDGKEQSVFEAMHALEMQRRDSMMYGAAACIISAVATGMYFYYRQMEVEQTSLQLVEQQRAIATQQQQELQLERQRVQELATINDSHKLLLANQEKLLEKSRQQYSLMRSRIHTARIEHIRLKRKYNPLKVEVKTLRQQNGVLNQRFIASTAGAIIMACVAGGFAIASHGGHGAAEEHTAVAAAAAHEGSTSSESKA